MEENKETALIVVEQPVEEIPPVEEAPKLNALFAAKKAGVENTPDGKNPFFIFYKEGLFLHVRSALGRFLVKQKTPPRHLKELGGNGYFWWEAPHIPAEVCAQAVDFFRRAWDTHKTEAGLYLLMDYETKEWSIFVPDQKVTGASVEYALPPEDIPKGKLVMGTMHSHCNFSPFHSGTDMHDAGGMNGVHFTVGYVDREKPEAVAMVIWNGTPFHFKPEDIGDFTQLDSAKAPIEWDEKLIPRSASMSDRQKKIFEKYAVQTKPVVYTTQPAWQTTTPYKSWEDRWADIPDEWDELYSHPKYPDRKYDSNSEFWKNRQQTSYWEDHLDKKVVDFILDSGLITDEDLDEAGNSPADAQETTYWIAVFLRKLSQTVTVLDRLGFVIDYHVKTKKIGEKDKKYDVIEDLMKILQDELIETKVLEGEFVDIEDALLPESKEMTHV